MKIKILLNHIQQIQFHILLFSFLIVNKAAIDNHNYKIQLL